MIFMTPTHLLISMVPTQAMVEAGWKLLHVIGPMQFGLSGLLIVTVFKFVPFPNSTRLNCFPPYDGSITTVLFVSKSAFGMASDVSSSPSLKPFPPNQ